MTVNELIALLNTILDKETEVVYLESGDIYGYISDLINDDNKVILVA